MRDIPLLEKATAITKAIRELIPTSPNIDKNATSTALLTLHVRHREQTDELETALTTASQNFNTKPITAETFWFLATTLYKFNWSPHIIVTTVITISSDPSSLSQEKKRIAIPTLFPILPEDRFTPITNNTYLATNSPTFRSPIYSESDREKLALYALLQRMGNCGELTEIARTFLKIDTSLDLSGYNHCRVYLAKHTLVILYKNSNGMTHLANSGNKHHFKDLFACCSHIKEITDEAVIIDPWLGFACSINSPDQLLSCAKALELDAFFNSTVTIALFHRCLAPTDLPTLETKHPNLCEFQEVFTPLYNKIKDQLQNQLQQCAQTTFKM